MNEKDIVERLERCKRLCSATSELEETLQDAIDEIDELHKRLAVQNDFLVGMGASV